MSIGTGNTNVQYIICRLTIYIVNSMDAHRLRCFVAVVEAGNLSAAARLLHMTQPPLSILIRKLESELDVNLFERVGNRLVLTPTGDLFYHRAKEMLASMQVLRRELRESEGGSRGTVRVGCSTAASLFIIPDVMSRLAEESLNITVQVQEGETIYLIQQLRDRRLDLAICRSHYAAADLSTRTLLAEPLLVALPPGHPLASNKAVKLADLRHERFLMHSSPLGRGISDGLIAACQDSGYTPDVIYWGVETLPMLLMVQRGLGIAFTPGSFARLGLAGLPTLVPLEDRKLETRLNLTTVRQHAVPRVVQQFIDLVDEVQTR